MTLYHYGYFLLTEYKLLLSPNPHFLTNSSIKVHQIFVV